MGHEQERGFRMTPGSDLAHSLDHGTVNWHKEGKVNSALAQVRLGYLYRIQADMSKHTCGCAVSR